MPITVFCVFSAFKKVWFSAVMSVFLQEFSASSDKRFETWLLLSDCASQYLVFLLSSMLSYAYSEANRTNLKNAEIYYKTTDFYLTEKLGK